MDPDLLAELAARYADGESFAQLAAAFGLSTSWVRELVHRQGVPSRPVGGSAPGRNSGAQTPPRGLGRRYRRGESANALAIEYGVSIGTVFRWLDTLGVPRRDVREASKLFQARTGEEYRHRRAESISRALAGRHRSEEELAAVAHGRQRSRRPLRPGAARLAEDLTRLGWPAVPWQAVGRYNVDLGLPGIPLAIEVLGQNWYRYRYGTDFAQRCRYLASFGWHLVFVWDRADEPLDHGAASEVVRLATAQAPSRAEPGLWILRGGGTVDVACTALDFEADLVPPTSVPHGTGSPC